MRLLIIDDNPSTLYLLQETIQSKLPDFQEIYTAENAWDAKDTIDKHGADIMLCDIEMPGKSGLSLIKDLRKEGNDILCVIITAYANFSFAQEAIELGCCEYILKPFTLDDVVDKLQRIIVQYRSRAQNEAYIRYGKIFMAEKKAFSIVQDSPENHIIQEENQDVKKAKQFIKDNYTQDIALKDIAEAVHLSPNYLIQIFKKYENTTPILYLTSVRIAQAKMLLLANRFSITQVALMTGFSNIPYFTNTFHKYTGMSPSAYRKKHSQ